MTDHTLDIVYYFEPWTELGRPYLRYHNLRHQMGPQIEALRDQGCRITVILGEATYAKCEKEGFYIPGVDYQIIPESELRQVFPDYLTATCALHNGTCSKEQESRMHDLIEDKLGQRAPDVFVSFLSPVDFLKDNWPDTLVLYTEFGIFSRFPYPRTFYFDAFGMFADSYVGRFSDELRNLKITKDQADKLNGFRSSIRDIGGFAQGEDIMRRSKLQRFSRNILLPLQFSSYFGFDASCDYRSQYDFMIDVLEKTPENVGVVVTEHSSWEPTLTEHNVDYLENRFPNLIIPRELLQYSNHSQLILNSVDAVASVSSSVGLQAAFWQKPVFAMGESHLNTFNAGQIQDAASVIDGFDPGAFDPAIHHLLERYYPTDRHAYDGESMLRFLKSSLAKKQAGQMDFDFYERLTDRDHYRKLTEDIRGDQLKRQMFKEQNVGKQSGRTGNTTETRIIEDFDVISFDIFDTLIQRPFGMPHQMFLFMQDDVRDLVGDPTFEFHKARRLSEHRVRQAAEAEGRDEVTIAEIYNHICQENNLPDDVRDSMIALEVEADYKSCEARPAGRKLFEAAAAAGKKIVIVSDYHVDTETVANLLQKSGYDGWSALYVSCDHGASKKAGGSLFEVVLRSEGMDPEQMLHIGDNHTSDVKHANKFHIPALHLPKAGDVFFKNEAIRMTWADERERAMYPTERLQKTSSALVGLFANRLFGDLDGVNRNSIFSNSASDLGYCLFGPLFTGFAKHLGEKASENDLESLVFLARDGSLLKRAFDEFHVDDTAAPATSYALSSRRSLSVPAMKNTKDVLEALAVPFAPTSLRHVLQNKFGLAETAIEAIDPTEFGFTSFDDRVHPAHQRLQMRRLLSKHSRLILDHAEREREAAHRYYADYIGDATGIVDVGYSGSLQNYLQVITETPIKGFYLMTHLKGKLFAEKGIWMDGFLGNFIDHTSKNSRYKDRISLLEMVCSSDERGLQRFDLDHEGNVDPQFQPNAKSIGRRRLVIAEIQKGIIDFIRDLRLHFGTEMDEIDLDQDLITRWAFDFFKAPASADARILNNIEHEDFFGGHDERFILADIVSRTGGKQSLRKEDANELVKKSDWKEGARAMLPLKTGGRKHFPDRKDSLVLRIADPMAHQEEEKEDTDKPRAPKPAPRSVPPLLAKLRKLNRDPKRFIEDFLRKRMTA